jgi:hypothetical protein
LSLCSVTGPGDIGDALAAAPWAPAVTPGFPLMEVARGLEQERVADGYNTVDGINGVLEHAQAERFSGQAGTARSELVAVGTACRR